MYDNQAGELKKIAEMKHLSYVYFVFTLTQ